MKSSMNFTYAFVVYESAGNAQHAGPALRSIPIENAVTIVGTSDGNTARNSMYHTRSEINVNTDRFNFGLRSSIASQSLARTGPFRFETRLMISTNGLGGLRSSIFCTVIIAIVLMFGPHATAQPGRPGTGPAPTRINPNATIPNPNALGMAGKNTGAVRVEAIAAEPYGVGQILVIAGQISADSTVRILVKERDDRIFFPAIDYVTIEPEPTPLPPSQTGPGRIGGGALVNRIRTAIQNAKEQINPPETLRIQFLFRGNDPLKIELTGDYEQSVEVIPTPVREDTVPQLTAKKALLPTDPKFQTLLASWWTGYIAQAKKQMDKSDYPSLIESYLTHMLAYRFGFDLPELYDSRKAKKQEQSDPMPTLSLVAGVEGLRAQIQHDLLLHRSTASQQTVPLPAAPAWRDMPVPLAEDNIAIEPIAKMIPTDCFYIRFGSFANYLWFQELSQSRGGDLAQMAVLRGFNYETNQRIERMLNTRMNFVAKLFGDSVIGDMALLGQDLYLQEGPTLGVVFEAKNVALLRTTLTQERTSAVSKFAKLGCRLETIDIDGTAVSFLYTPDNQIRSFLVERGNYIMLSTSKELVRKFLSVKDGQGSLANSPSFRFARWIMPLENKYDMFVYLSSEFFRNLVSPQYQIELRRRLKAIAAIELAEMASLTANAERLDLRLAPANQPNAPVSSNTPEEFTIDKLVELGYLPPWFQERSDRSETLMYQGRWHDSLRGRRGSFLPIADAPVTECSVEEAELYRDQANYYATKWRETDPLMVGIRRFAHPEIEKAERVTIEAYVAPLGAEKYGWMSTFLAPPVRTYIQLPPDDMVNAQVHMAGQSTQRSFAPDHVMFVGLKDMVPPLPGETKGLLATLRTLQSLPAYLGAWPRPGYLDRLPLGFGGGPPDVLGFSRLLIGAWRWQASGFSVLSFDRSILENCAMYLRPVPADDFAQARFFVGDVSKSKLSAWFNTYWFRRAAQTTRGNLLLLDSMQQQLKVPAKDSLARAEQLLDAKLQCSLGGQYSLDEDQFWVSNAWPQKFELVPNAKASTSLGFDPAHSLPPEKYVAPWMEWFRGAKVHLTQLPERLVLVGHVDLLKLPVVAPNEANTNGEEAPLPSMNIDLFNLPFQFFKGDKPKGNKPDEKAPEPANPAKENRKSF